MTYKLTYFDGLGFGEPIRYLLSYGGIDFEDNRIAHEAWPALKPDMPFGKLPVLEYKGKVAHQSFAICRYVAKQVKLVGKNDWEDLEIDATVDTINDLIQKIMSGLGPNQAGIKEQFSNENVIFYLKKIDEQIKKNNGYLVLGRLTWADFVFAALCPLLVIRSGENVLAGYSNIEENLKRIQELPRIKEWLVKHPLKK